MSHWNAASHNSKQCSSNDRWIFLSGELLSSRRREDRPISSDSALLVIVGRSFGMDAPFNHKQWQWHTGSREFPAQNSTA